jgi:hypothetical protein
MSKARFSPVPAPIVEAARQARARGLSLRAIAAELAAKGILGPSGGPYLPGSIACMVRGHDHVAVDVLPVIDDPDIELDQLEAASAVDAVPTPATEIVDAALEQLPVVDTILEQPAAPIVDAAVFDAAHGLLFIDSPPIDAEQLPVTDEPAVDAQPVDERSAWLMAPAVDAEPAPAPEQPAVQIIDTTPPIVATPSWEPRRGSYGQVDVAHLLRRLSEFPHLQQAAMSSAGLRVEQMEDLFSQPSACEAVANYLHHFS